MSDNHPMATYYEDAMERLEPYITTADDGTLHLNIRDFSEIGIEPPIVLFDLVRSLKETNKKILNGEIAVGQVIGDLE
jgi:hypothetical protein